MTFITHIIKVGSWAYSVNRILSCNSEDRLRPLATAQTPVPAQPKAAALERWRSSDLILPSLTDGWGENETLHSASVVSPEAVSRPLFARYGQR